jgi:hypothetical protein
MDYDIPTKSLFSSCFKNTRVSHRIPMKLSAMMMMVSAKFPIDITRLYGKVNVFARSPLNPNVSG